MANNNINTEIGKIYCSYNEEKDSFDMMRLVRIDPFNGNEDDKVYVFRYLDENFHMLKAENPDDTIGETHFDLNEVKKNYTLLKSDGIVSLTNIVAVENETQQIKDVLAIFFPNNKYTELPDAHQPYVVARQGINDIFAEMEGIESVGMSVSLDTLPTGYALSDFMENTRVLSSHLCHVYKTDTDEDIATLLENEESSTILRDLFDHQIRYYENTIPDYEFKEKDDYDSVLGYSKTIKGFLLHSQFMYEFYNRLGIAPVDFKCESGKPLSNEEKVLVSALLGGVHIDKAVPLKFDYTINMDIIKMKYFLVIDTDFVLYIIPYTESPDEIDGDSMYKLTEESTIQLQERLSRCARAYGNVVHKQDDLKMS